MHKHARGHTHKCRLLNPIRNNTLAKLLPHMINQPNNYFTPSFKAFVYYLATRDITVQSFSSVSNFDLLIAYFFCSFMEAMILKIGLDVIV